MCSKPMITQIKLPDIIETVWDVIDQNIVYNVDKIYSEK